MDTGPMDLGQPDGGAPDPLMLCAQGERLVHYSLTPVSPVPPASAISLENLPASIEVVSAQDGNSLSMRLDVCIAQDGAPSLRAILLRPDEIFSPYLFRLDTQISSPEEDFIELDLGFVQEVRLPPQNMLVQGLAEALGGDLAQLDVRLVAQSGLRVAGHAQFLAVARGRVTNNSIEYTTNQVIVGGLAPGDIFEDLQCNFGEQTLSRTFRMDSAEFEVGACTFLGGGFTTGYRIHRLAITDSNPALSMAEQQRFEFTTEAEVEAVLNYVWNHHNACDSFHLALPHADYAASTSPAAGCGATVPNAPEREFDENPILPVLYRIRYHGGPWTDGQLDGCSHYLFCQ